MQRETSLRAALSEPAFGLAALRIAVTGVLLVSPELHAAPALAAQPEALVASPEGLGWMAGLSISPELVRTVRGIAVSAGATALLGYWSRLSCAVLLLSAAFLNSFAQRAGATLHDMHLLWLLALLAASRCGDVWSLDAWGEPRASASLTYGVPLCLARALLGVAYFFPGLHKLLSGGLDWGTASHVRAVLYSKWFQHGQVPSMRLDTLPSWLLELGGRGVVMFELSFIVLALWPSKRLLALGLGLWFHLSTQLFFFIGFASLWVCYVVLLPWQRWLRVPVAGETEGNRAPLPWPSLAVGLLMLVPAVVQGARGQTQAYPFACYPTFEQVGPAVAPDLIAEVVTPDGSVVRLERDFSHYRTQQQWGQVYWLLGAYGGRASDEQLRRFVRQRADDLGKSQALANAVRVRLLAADYSTRPADWGKPPIATLLLRELAWP